jgi:hypothetical protein
VSFQPRSTVGRRHGKYPISFNHSINPNPPLFLWNTAERERWHCSALALSFSVGSAMDTASENSRIRFVGGNMIQQKGPN